MPYGHRRNAGRGASRRPSCLVAPAHPTLTEDGSLRNGQRISETPTGFVAVFWKARARVGKEAKMRAFVSSAVTPSRNDPGNMPVRIGIDIAATLISVVGVVLVIEPEIGLPIMLVALRLLANEFDWAARLYARVERARFKRFMSNRGHVAASADVVVVAAAVALVWLALS